MSRDASFYLSQICFLYSNNVNIISLNSAPGSKIARSNTRKTSNDKHSNTNWQPKKPVKIIINVHVYKHYNKTNLIFSIGSDSVSTTVTFLACAAASGKFLIDERTVGSYSFLENSLNVFPNTPVPFHDL